MAIQFFKYQGTGNDFIILDNRENQIPPLTTKQIKYMCEKRFGIGADGLMLFNTKAGFDFEMKYYNADGREGSMCGNGSRCIVKFAASMGTYKSTYHFLASDGEHEAEIDDNIISVKMKDVNKIRTSFNDYILDTGSPHFVKYDGDVKAIDVKKEGSQIRYGKEFAAEGINVNFVSRLSADEIFVRTYERGVEDETLSCGTGVTASALVSAHNDKGFNRVEVKTPGGHLSVEFEKIDENNFSNIWLCGPAEFVYKGEINFPVYD